MFEPIPQFTFSSEEGILQFRSDEPDIGLPARNNTYLEQLAELPGIEIAEDETTKAILLRMNVRETLGTIGDDQIAIGGMVRNISRLNTIPTHRLRNSNADRVAYPDLSADGRGVSVGVYQQFQRWLNTQKGADEALAREVSSAMAIPFGEAAKRRLEDEFRMPKLDSRNPFAGNKTFGMMLAHTNFRISHREKSHTPEYGSVPWGRVSLITKGMLYEAYELRPDRALDITNVGHRPYLYKGASLGTRERSPLSGFSILIGVGVLASHAAAHKGKENILKDVVITNLQ